MEGAAPPPRPPHFYAPAGDRLFFFAHRASPSQLSLQLAFPLAIAPLSLSLSLARCCFFFFPAEVTALSEDALPAARRRSEPAVPPEPEGERDPARCHLPAEEEAAERAGAIYRHPKAQGKGELLWHLIPASAPLFPLTGSLALLWQCGKYIFFSCLPPVALPTSPPPLLTPPQADEQQNRAPRSVLRRAVTAPPERSERQSCARPLGTPGVTDGELEGHPTSRPVLPRGRPAAPLFAAK